MIDPKTMSIVLNLLAFVESGWDPQAVGDNGKALGIFQLHKIYVDDVNRIFKKQYTHQDALDPVKAMEIVTMYLTHYAPKGIMLDNELAVVNLCRIHNAGPGGHMKYASVDYGKRIRKLMEDKDL